MSETRSAIAAAVSFLLKNQDADGAWRDFRVKPGRSDAWTTAYIAIRLRRAQRASSNPDVAPALERAAKFMFTALDNEGWGYNYRCAADADTTAHAILFLRAMSCDVRPRDYANLAKFQAPCGGFATYKMNETGHGWGMAHPDVTAVALRALCGFVDDGHDIIRRGLASLLIHLQGPHGSESYWWRSHLYLPMQVCMLAEACAGARSLPFPLTVVSHISGNFDLALALELAVRRADSQQRIHALRNQLLAQSRRDGSWPSDAALRITDPRSRDFSDEHFVGSPVAMDDRRLFTTATALGALVSREF